MSKHKHTEGRNEAAKVNIEGEGEVLVPMPDVPADRLATQPLHADQVPTDARLTPEGDDQPADEAKRADDRALENATGKTSADVQSGLWNQDAAELEKAGHSGSTLLGSQGGLSEDRLKEISAKQGLERQHEANRRATYGALAGEAKAIEDGAREFRSGPLAEQRALLDQAKDLRKKLEAERQKQIEIADQAHRELARLDEAIHQIRALTGPDAPA